jgi:hypothetical protein
MQNLHNNYTEKNLEIYTVDQYADSKTSNCILSLSENNDTPDNVRTTTLRRIHVTTVAM